MYALLVSSFYSIFYRDERQPSMENDCQNLLNFYIELQAKSMNKGISTFGNFHLFLNV